MRGWIQEARSARSIFVVLFALVLAIRITIPTGYMPTVAPSGIVITVCTGMGQTKTFLPIEKDGDQDRHSAAEGPCTFAAGLGGGLVPTTHAHPEPVALPPAAAVSRVIADLTVHRLAAPPPPAIGPPARA